MMNFHLGQWILNLSHCRRTHNPLKETPLKEILLPLCQTVCVTGQAALLIMQNTLTSIQNYGHHQDQTRATTQSQTLKAMEDTCSCLHSLELPYQQLSPLSQRVLGKPRLISCGRSG